MALLKNIEDFGIPLEYWRIEEVTLNKIHKTGSIILTLFANKEAKYGITKMIFPIETELFEEYFGLENRFRDIYNSAYEYIKFTNKEKDLLDDKDELMR